MSSLLHGLGLLLLPLCGWLAGDAVQAQTTLHLTALQHTIELLQRIRQRYSTAGQTCKASTGSFAARAFCHKIPAVHCSSCLHRGSFQQRSVPALQSALAESAAQRPHRNASGWVTIRRGLRTIYSRHAAQHSGRPVCRTVWGWLAV